MSLMALCSAAVVIFNPAGYVTADGRRHGRARRSRETRLHWGFTQWMYQQVYTAPKGEPCEQ